MLELLETVARSSVFDFVAGSRDEVTEAVGFSPIFVLPSEVSSTGEVFDFLRDADIFPY